MKIFSTKRIVVARICEIVSAGQCGALGICMSYPARLITAQTPGIGHVVTPRVMMGSCHEHHSISNTPGPHMSHM